MASKRITGLEITNLPGGGIAIFLSSGLGTDGIPGTVDGKIGFAFCVSPSLTNGPFGVTGAGGRGGGGGGGFIAPSIFFSKVSPAGFLPFKIESMSPCMVLMEELNPPKFSGALFGGGVALLSGTFGTLTAGWSDSGLNGDMLGGFGGKDGSVGRTDGVKGDGKIFGKDGGSGGSIGGLETGGGTGGRDLFEGDGGIEGRFGGGVRLGF